ncbi:alanine/ornithine racemase family PLP-dependent enzyme [Neptunicoccus cionae]|uniref:alanine/ornithine racemase family PLP-dependent enzyme n=1 Tax=Neptunicoccus cionae TaxID=2035344 RepID=UPI000C75DA5B|nr:alanine/ornithine racemase family PLP-dependent enzyme [Amylibacter cionae]PLS20924.1 amino-acid racemase [Amylibacter cionae]
MNSPRLEVDLRKISHNTRTIVGRLQRRGIRVSAVTKAVCGHPAIAQAMLNGGAAGLAEARLSNVKRLRRAGITCPVTMIRTPMLSQVEEVVQLCETSYNTEVSVISALGAAALRHNKVHGIILMIEMGDMREGILPQNTRHMVRRIMDTPGVALKGIGANFACLNGIAPTDINMRTLSFLANDIECQFRLLLQTVSGGNSANLTWAFGPHATGRINDLRLGEAILLGVDPITGAHIDGTYRDAFTLVAEVIETDAKSLRPLLRCADQTIAKNLFFPVISKTTRIVLAIGEQDTDAAGLSMPANTKFVGATSDHLILEAKDVTLLTGSEIRFQLGYGALMHAMAAPDVETILRSDRSAPNAHDAHGPDKHLASV